MFKRLILNNLFRLRGFMQEELLSELRIVRGEVDHLRQENNRMSSDHDQLVNDHERLREALDRLNLFDHSVKTLEDGLLSMALQQDREPAPRESEYLYG